MDHYINTNALDLAMARSVSLTSPSQYKVFPVLGYGDESPQNFYFHADGAIDSFSGNSAYGLRVTIGNPTQGPTSGTFTLTFGANTTTALSATATAAQIQTALNALASITSAGGVVVTGTNPNFIIVFVVAGAVGAITASNSQLIPASSVALTTLVSGGASQNQQTALILAQNYVFQSTSWTRFTNQSNGAQGWTGDLFTNTAACLALLMQQGVAQGNLLQVQTTITVELINPDASFTTYYQAPLLIRAKISALGGAISTTGQLFLGAQFPATNGNSTDSFNFPNSFPNSCVSLAPTLLAPTGAPPIDVWIQPGTVLSKTGFSVEYGAPLPATGYILMIVAVGT